jgi:hypothetical protein
MVTAIIWIAAIRIEEASAAPKNIRAVSWLPKHFFRIHHIQICCVKPLLSWCGNGKNALPLMADQYMQTIRLE